MLDVLVHEAHWNDWNEAGQMTEYEAQIMLHALVGQGWLIGVEVFGADDCCEHGMYEECPANGFGLCDVFSKHSAGSDCNRAEDWLMRPKDGLMTESLHRLLNEELT